MPSIPGSSRILGIFVALQLAISGCGESNSANSGGEAKTEEASSGGQSATEKPIAARCPVRASRVNTNQAPRARTMGAPFEVELNEEPKPPRAEITVVAVRHPKRIDRHYQGSGTFVPKTGRFVAVVFHFRNVGASAIEAANTVGDFFALTSRPPTTRYPRADGSPECNVISASFARSIGATSPEEDVKPGKAYKTVVVYVVRDDEVEVDWFAPNTGDLVTLSAPPAG